jgi:peptidoglycan/xylan/chitin deacetylase (PgdA/CDA1 family)
MHHRRLTDLPSEQARAEMTGSLADLEEELEAPLRQRAYPNGAHDSSVCEAARQAGYEAAYTTEKGRNGAAADPHALRRVSIHGADGAAAVLWKAATGEGLPQAWLRMRRRLGRG